MIDSRSKLRRHNERNDVVDVGNDGAWAPGRAKARSYEPRGVAEDVQAVMQRLGGY